MVNIDATNSTTTTKSKNGHKVTFYYYYGKVQKSTEKYVEDPINFAALAFDVKRERVATTSMF